MFFRLLCALSVVISLIKFGIPEDGKEFRAVGWITGTILCFVGLGLLMFSRHPIGGMFLSIAGSTFLWLRCLADKVRE